jgi:hypothetical protein
VTVIVLMVVTSVLGPVLTERFGRGLAEAEQFGPRTVPGQLPAEVR